MADLEEKLAQTRHGEEAARKENDDLRRDLESLRTQMSETDQQLAAARRRMEDLTGDNERYAEDASVEVVSLPMHAPVETNGHPDLAARMPAAARRSAEAGDWLSFN
jgi:septal ring factor EnvC (AmiA/AmiB activator)